MTDERNAREEEVPFQFLPKGVVQRGPRTFYACTLRAADIRADPPTFEMKFILPQLFYAEPLGELRETFEDTRYQLYCARPDGTPELAYPLRNGDDHVLLLRLYTAAYGEAMARTLLSGRQRIALANFFFRLEKDVDDQYVPGALLTYARIEVPSPAPEPALPKRVDRVYNSTWPGKVAEAQRSLKTLQKDPAFEMAHAADPAFPVLVTLRIPSLPFPPDYLIEYNVWWTINNRLTAVVKRLQRAVDDPVSVKVDDLCRCIQEFQSALPAVRGTKEARSLRGNPGALQAPPIHPSREPDDRCTVGLRALCNEKLVSKEPANSHPLVLPGPDYTFTCEMYFQQPGGTVLQLYPIGSTTPLISRTKGAAIQLVESLYARAYNSVVAHQLIREPRNLAVYFYVLNSAGQPDVLLHQRIVRNNKNRA